MEKDSNNNSFEDRFRSRLKDKLSELLEHRSRDQQSSDTCDVNVRIDLYDSKSIDSIGHSK